MTKNVLTVDDSRSIRQMVAFTLKGAGYGVVEAEHGRAAIDALSKTTVAMVLADHNMPVMDGLTLIKELRAMPQFARLPIVMLTTESSDEMKAKGRAAGATGWMVKPFDPRRLVEVVRKVIG